MKLEDSTGKDALPVDMTSIGGPAGLPEELPSPPGLMKRMRSFFTGEVLEEPVGARWYESFEKLLPLLLALVAIGIKLWLYW